LTYRNRSRNSLHLYNVNFWYAFGSGHGVGKRSVVREDDQPFGVEIKPTHGMQPSVTFYQVCHKLSAFRVRNARQIPFRFIQKYVSVLSVFEGRVYQLAADLDVVCIRIGFCSEFHNGFPVNGNFAFEDELLGRTTRCNTGLGDQFL